MTYTLFVDESGTFDRERDRWVVAGALIPGRPSAAEAKLSRNLAPVMRAHPERITHPKGLHLTEFRRSAGRAIRVAEAVFDALTKIPSVRVSAVRNRRRVIVGDRSGPVETFERSYRLMILDLLTLFESSRPLAEPVSELHLVVATRTAGGERMSSLAEVGDDVLDQIVDAAEAGLASRGLLLAADRRRLHHQRASGSWGLAAADVVANVTFHEADRDGRDRELIERFGELLGFRVFDAFGGYEVRRARVAEREDDLPLALSRWALWRPTNAAGRKERDAAIERLAARLFAMRDPYAPRANLEATLERLRLAESAPEALGKALSAIEEAVAMLASENGPSEADAEGTESGRMDRGIRRVLFRLRSFSRVVANERADLEEAIRLHSAQAEARAAVASEPEGFPLVLDDDVRAVNTHTQRLELAEGLAAARDHFELVRHYGEVWDLLEQGGAFTESRVYVRAAQSLARHLAFAAPLATESEAAEWLVEADRLLGSLESLESLEDRSRLRNDRILVKLRLDHTDEALALAIFAVEGDDSGSEPSLYDHYYACRVASAALLRGADGLRGDLQRIYERVTEAEPSFALRHNPAHLAWRERALLASLLGFERQAQAALNEAAARTGALSGDGPLKRWLSLVVGVYRDALSGIQRPLRIHADVREGEGGHEALVACAELLAARNGRGVLGAVRATTPY